MKTLLVIFAILVVAIFIVFTIGFSNSSFNEKVDITAIDWRLPEILEKTQIEKTFFLSDIDSCKDFYVKKIFNDQFIVACSIGSTWKYYNVYTKQKRIFIADDITVADLTEPSEKVETNSSPEIIEEYSSPKQQVIIKEAR